MEGVVGYRDDESSVDRHNSALVVKFHMACPSLRRVSLIIIFVGRLYAEWDEAVRGWRHDSLRRAPNLWDESLPW
jgi:hypothetical protein